VSNTAMGLSFPSRAYQTKAVIIWVTLSYDCAASTDSTAIGCRACLDRSPVSVLLKLASSAVLPFLLQCSSGGDPLSVSEFVASLPKTKMNC
jgi:hypothetical protein